MNCEYCKKEFKTISYLNYHKKNAKYCLKLQNELGIEQKNNNHYECQICFKVFNKDYFAVHFKNKCITNILELNNTVIKNKQIISDIESKNKEMEKKIKDLEIEIKNKEKIESKNIQMQMEKKIKDLETENNILKGVNSVLKSDHECLQDMAKQPKNVVNTNNKILNIVSPLDFTNKEIIKNKIDSNYKIDYIFSGQKGIAKFAIDHILKDEEGNLKYVCTDPSRQIFKYKDETGEVRKDVEAKKLTNFLVEGGIKDKASDIMNEWWTEETGMTNVDKFELLVDKAKALRIIDSDNNEFKKELATMTTV